MEQKYDLDRYLEERKTEEKKHAIAALNRALGWCRQIGIEIFESYADNSLVFDSSKIVIEDGEVCMKKEGEDEQSQSKSE